MKAFLDEDFLLHTKTAQHLYHQYAKEMPVIDYHNHLPPQEIAEDRRFQNLTQAWLYGDHYKWRAMRANGVDESYCTGNRSDEDKFLKWAETVPYTLRNPLYHWTHLELQRYFGVKKLLSKQTAKEIYNHGSELLQAPEYSVRNLLRKMNVRLLCTTDDPTDTLEYHRQLKDEFEIKVLPAFRPDNAMNVEEASVFNQYLSKLESVADISITGYADYIAALLQRHNYFAANGCTVSDHGLETMYADDVGEKEAASIFSIIRSGKELNEEQKSQFKSAMLLQFAEWDWQKGWVQQYHLGAMRNNNSRALRTLGKDTGWDSVGDYSQGIKLSRFLSKLDGENKLAKTVLYNLNPADNTLFATMTGNFNDGSAWGKVQWGAAWWFLDQKDGMTQQLNTLSNTGLLSCFVGMLTDSRSFLSFPRHEYFRRVLCNLLGDDIERGELPNETEWIGKMVQDICYRNARDYFGWQPVTDEKYVAPENDVTSA